MTRRIVVVPPELALPEAWEIMFRGGFRHLPVVKNGLLLGILSDRDVLTEATKLENGELEIPPTRVSHAMTSAPYVCDPDTPVADIVLAMIRLKIDAAPVVDATDRLVGLVTSTDLMKLLLNEEGAGRITIPFEFELDEPGTIGVGDPDF